MEWENGYIPGAVLISLGALRGRMAELPRDRAIAVICEAGIRSAVAAGLLLDAGFERVSNVSDGMGGYRNAGRPLAIFEADD